MKRSIAAILYALVLVHLAAPGMALASGPRAIELSADEAAACTAGGGCIVAPVAVLEQAMREVFEEGFGAGVREGAKRGYEAGYQAGMRDAVRKRVQL